MRFTESGVSPEVLLCVGFLFRVAWQASRHLHGGHVRQRTYWL